MQFNTAYSILLIFGGSGANMTRAAFLELSSTQNPDMQRWGLSSAAGATIKWCDDSVFHFFLAHAEWCSNVTLVICSLFKKKKKKKKGIPPLGGTRDSMCVCIICTC